MDDCRESVNAANCMTRRKCSCRRAFSYENEINLLRRLVDSVLMYFTCVRPWLVSAAIASSFATLLRCMDIIKKLHWIYNSTEFSFEQNKNSTLEFIDIEMLAAILYYIPWIPFAALICKSFPTCTLIPCQSILASLRFTRDQVLTTSCERADFLARAFPRFFDSSSSRLLLSDTARWFFANFLRFLR